MSTKTLLITSVLFGFLLSAAAGVCFADAAEELEQALSYDQTGNYEQAETAYQQVVTEYPDSDEAFAAQKQLTALYALRANEAEAQAAMAKLLADFSEREYLPQAVHEIVEKCGKSRDDSGCGRSAGICSRLRLRAIMLYGRRWGLQSSISA